MFLHANFSCKSIPSYTLERLPDSRAPAAPPRPRRPHPRAPAGRDKVQTHGYPVWESAEAIYAHFHNNAMDQIGLDRMAAPDAYPRLTQHKARARRDTFVP